MYSQLTLSELFYAPTDFSNTLLDKTWKNLSELNQMLIQHISRDFLGIDTEFRDSRQYRALLNLGMI